MFGLLVPLLAAALSLLPAQAQSRRLNGPLPRPGATDLLEDFALSPDGGRLVFRGDVLEDETFELFSSPADASTPPVRLNPPLVPGGEVVRFALGSQRAVYLADQDDDEVFELFSVPFAGGAVLELSGTLVGGGDVLDFLVTSDGSSVVFAADGLVDGQEELFRVPLDGSAARIALDPSPNEDGIEKLWITPDDTRVLFTRRKVTPLFPFGSQHLDRLFSLTLDGSQSKVLIAEAHVPRSPLGTVLGRSIVELQFSADGQRAIYTDRVEDDEDGEIEVSLNSAVVDGSQAPIVLSQGASNYSSLPFAVSSTLARAVFLELGHLFSIALDGTGRVRLDPAGWTVRPPNAYHFAITPDGTSVVFDAQNSALLTGVLQARVDGSQPARLLDGPSNFSLVQLAPTDTSLLYASRSGPYFDFLAFIGVYSVPLDGSAARSLLNGPALQRTGGNTLLPTAGELLFRNSYSFESDLELFVAPQDGSLAPRRISAPMTSGRDVERYLLAPDGQGVVYRADQTFDGVFELFRTSVGGGKPRNFLPLSPGPVVGDVLSFQVAPDGRSIVFAADQDTDEEFRFYHVPSSGKTSPTRVGRFPFQTGVFLSREFAFAPAGDRLVEFRTTISSELYSVGLAPGSNEIRIGNGRVGGPLEFTPDGARVVFKTDQVIVGTELVSVPLDGSGLVPLFRLRGRNVLDYQVTPDGRTVVYQADASAEGKFDLFRVPVEGGAPAVRLNPALATNRDVSAFQITPDGSEVVYIADERTNDVFELFVAPLDLSRPARRLSGALVALGDVADFVFTPDGKRVVFRADALANNRFDLFSVPLSPSTRGFQRPLGDGEPDVVQLTFLDNSFVQPDYRVAVDGTQVFFRADVDRAAGLEPDRPELFRVTMLGGETARLNQSLHDNGQVLSFELSPDKTRIVYLADKGGGDVRELFAVGVLGGAVAALDPLPAFADVSVYHVTPDSRGVVYLCDRELDEAWQLFRAALDGSAPPEVLNDPLPAGGDVQADFVALADGSVVYRADQAADEVFELFSNRRFPR